MTKTTFTDAVTAELTALRDALKAADGPDSAVDYEIWLTVDEKGGYPKNYTHSLDAALALKERVLPGWDVQLFIGPDGFADAEIMKAHNEEDENGFVESVWAGHKHPAIALCTAIVEAVMRE